MLDPEITAYLKALKGTPGPYPCNLCKDGDKKLYKTVVGLQYHINKYHPEVGGGSPATPMTPTSSNIPKKQKKKGKNTPKADRNKNSPQQNAAEAENQIFFDDHQNLVLKVGMNTIPIPIEEEMPVISTEMLEKMTSHSNYEITDIEPPKDPVINLPEAVFQKIDDYNIADALQKHTGYIRFIEKTPEELDGEIEYDLDEEDTTWLDIVNEKRNENGLNEISTDVLELLIDRLEKESYFQAASNGQAVSIIDEDAICCICLDGECQNTNVILFCDMCNLAVHQDCYGVPYIPENQWLCRQCLQSPSKPVQCKLCPNTGGAFKQTDTGEWAHVVCALWIPEVRFANTVFLEPIDSIDCIPPARWRLVCYICKQKTGACIQCNKNYCYSAFHVTCAQYAGLCMRMETVKSNDGQMMVQKFSFCDQHAPLDHESSPLEREKAQEKMREKMKQARKLIAKKRSSAPIILIPTIPAEKIQEISNLVNFKKKDQFMQRLIAYWTLKRHFKNGVPLIRRLQTSQSNSHSKHGLEGSPDAKELYKQLKYWQHLRQDLERARLLCELVRKREKLKLLYIKTNEEVVMSQVNPLGMAMHKIIDQLVAKDTLEIFLEPVDTTEVPDYATVIKNPIDLGTMRENLNKGYYSNLDDLEADFQLMIRNCLLYNDKETIFYKMGVKMKEQGLIIFRQARKELERSGMIEAPIADGEIVKQIDSELKEILSGTMSLEMLKKLEDLMVKANTIKHHLTKGKRVKMIKYEMIKIKKKLKVKGMSDESDEESENDQEEKELNVSNLLKTPDSKKQQSESLSSSLKMPSLNTSPLSAGVNRRNAILFTRKQQILKKPELSMDLSSARLDDSIGGSSMGEFKKVEEKKKGRGRKQGWRKSGNISTVSESRSTPIAEPKKSMLLTPSVIPNTNITLEAPRFDQKIPDSFRVYRGQGSNSENSENSEFSDSCTSCEFSDSFSNSEYGSSGDEDDGSDSEVNSDSARGDDDSQGTTTTRTSDKKEEEGNSNSSDDIDRPMMEISGELKPLQLVWAKSRGYPSYPALIIDPSLKGKSFVHNSVPLPCPPENVLSLRKTMNEEQFLVLFFDAKRTWQWLPKSKLELLGFNKNIDEIKLIESKKPTLRKAVKKAYEEALHYQSQVTKKKPEGKL